MTEQQRTLKALDALSRVAYWSGQTPAVTGKPVQQTCGYPDDAALRRIHEIAEDALAALDRDEDHTDDGIN